MKTIFITITRGSIIRNYLHSGVISALLKSDVKVVALVPFFDNTDLVKEITREGVLCEPLMYPKKVVCSQLMGEFSRGAIFNKTIRTYYKYSFFNFEPHYAYYYPRAVLYSLIKCIPGIKRFVRKVDRSLNPQFENDYLFKKYSPDLVFSTTPHDRGDIGVIRSAKRHGVRVLGMPKSWDNLSKILFPEKLDHMFVWSQYMKDEALRFQDFKEKEISVVGIPQFDFYTKKNLLMTRKEFCVGKGLDPEKKIILYGSAGALFPEAGYIALIQKYKEKGGLQNTQVLMRPHVGYNGEMEKFDSVERNPDFIVDRSDKQSLYLKDKWDVSMNHVINLYNSLHHADVCVNIASTLTLDAIACGTPVVNICFDLKKELYKKSIQRVYETDYIDAVQKFGATYVARSDNEFSNCLEESLQRKDEKSGQVNDVIDYLIHKVDGRSAQRLSEGILRFLC